MRKPASVLAAVLVALSVSSGAFAADLYVLVGAAPGGDGSKSRPFPQLGAAEAASKPGDRIYVFTKAPSDTLSVSITLKPNQKLIGLSPDGRTPKGEAEMPRLTSAASDGVVVNTTNGSYAPTGFIVKLAKGVEVSGLHFVDMKSPALLAGNEDISGAHIHDNLFSGVMANAAGLIYALALGGAASVANVRVTDNTFRDGDNLGGVSVQQRGSSTGEYRFERNHFSDLGGRAYHIHSAETSKVTTAILDSDVDNIGVGNKNSDSVIPYLLGQSQQTMLVKNFRFKNTKQVGNASNTALEIFIYGPPRPEADKANWCTACRVDLVIEDSIFERSASDGVQVSNSGSNSIVNVTIRRTKIINASPRQVGGAVSLGVEGAQNSGSKLTLMIEDSEITGSSAFAFANTNQSKGAPVAVVDLGGGPLGSKGRNVITGNAKGALSVQRIQVTAKNNWWGGEAPVVVLNGEGAAADTSSPLNAPPTR
jgi:hypothetical protein